ncbi:helix-hairpin-helix domain-containing protein [Ruminococcus sp.]|uniref:ComEA family DNA-binding protein n=1 Tax=Ruminococcus sp. TaxID=41978 RepID=UPI0025CF7AFA|nr:helix-hairpin-helix domain-containing protein [Ruminococcus sp.]MCR4639127.1 helix-hairpin-helix domain-containing protein [Ruminococcus sp.]
MKKDDPIRKYLLFFIMSAAVIGAAVFFFHTADKTENTRNTVTIIPKTEVMPTDFTRNTSSAVTSKIRTTASRTTSHKTKTTAVPTSAEYVRIDINSADADELAKLKGIGTVLAQEIISYRESCGGFRNIEEIMNVKGIGENIFADIREHIYVLEPVYDEPEDETDISDIPETEQDTTEHVPTLEELAPININTAERDILMLLPHVDEDTAGRIIDFRERTGGFQNEYELLLIEGLSRSDVAEIMDYITI